MAKKKKKKSKWFDFSAFDDGYDVGDITKTVVNSVKQTSKTIKKNVKQNTQKKVSNRNTRENNTSTGGKKNASTIPSLSSQKSNSKNNRLSVQIGLKQNEKKTDNGFLDFLDNKSKKETKPTVTTQSSERKWFNKGLFEDGYDFGDVTKTILGTARDVGTDLNAGVGRIGEGLIDTGAYVAGGVAKALGNDEFADKTKQFISRNLVDEYNVGDKIMRSNPLTMGIAIADDLLNKGQYEKSSLLGDKTDSLVQSSGQLLGTMGLQAVGVPWYVTTGVTGFGTGVDEAFDKDATYGESGLYGGISGVSEVAFERLGGIKFGGKALDDGAKKLLSKAVTNKLAKNLGKFGLDAGAEGFEEILTEITQNFGKGLTYEDEKTMNELLTSEEAMDQYIEAFIGGAVMGGGFNVGKLVQSHKTGRDYDTGLTDNEQSVVNKEVETRTTEKKKAVAVEKEIERVIAERTKHLGTLDDKAKKLVREEVQAKLDNGELDFTTTKLSKKEISEIEKQVDEDLKSGYIGIDAIESTLSSEKTSRINELRDALDKTTKDTEKSAIESELRQLERARAEEMKELLKKDNFLQESYHQEVLKGESFDRKTTDKDSDITKELIESAKFAGMNNTRKMHNLFEYTNKIANDTKTKYGFVNNEQLKQLGHEVEGKTINGLVRVTEDGSAKVLINVDSAKALNTIIGHETTHLLEGTAEHKKLVDIVKEYATTKGDYDARLKEFTGLYQGVNADIENEITADLVGDYLFTDENFIMNLSAKEPNIFQKVYDYIKHVYKMATAGSSEARQLAQAKRMFDKAYKQMSKTVTQETKTNSLTEADSNIRHSLGYHAGDLGKSEHYGMQGYGRGTGHFGTGTYFVGDKAKIEGYNTRGGKPAPVEAVEFDNYNLYRPTDKNGYELHQALKVLDGGVTEDWVEKVESLQFRAIDSTERFDIAEEMFGEDSYKTRNRVEALQEFARRHNIEHTSVEEFEEMFEPYPDSFYDDVSEEIKAELIADDFYDQYREVVEKEILKKVERTNEDYDEFREAHRTLSRLFGLTRTEDALREVARREIPKDYKAQDTLDSNATVFMKSLGYEGIDVRGTSLDNTRYGSVIYDLKGKDLERKQEIGTARYSISDTNGRELTKGQQEFFKNSKARDDEGRLVPVYHTTSQGGFTVFDNKKSDDDLSFFFTDNFDMSQTYARHAENPIPLGENNTIESAFSSVLENLKDDYYFTVGKEITKAKKLTLNKLKSLCYTEKLYFVATDSSGEVVYEDIDDFIKGYETGETSDINEIIIDDGNIEIGRYTWNPATAGYYETYLNLENPMIVDGKGKNWNHIQLMDDVGGVLSKVEDYMLLVNDYDYVDMSMIKENLGNLTDAVEGLLQETEEIKQDEGYEYYTPEEMEKLRTLAAEIDEIYENWDEDAHLDPNGDPTPLGWYLMEAEEQEYTTRELARKAKGEGYDGVIIKNIYDEGPYGISGAGMGDVYIAFDSNQIKSVANENPTQDPDIRYSLTDNNGRELSKEQREYFKDSKVRDENGNLKVMYHGTANDFTVFNPMLQGGKNGTAEGYGLYFADTSEVSDAYGGKLMKGYLDVKRPATSYNKTIKKGELTKLIKATCEAEAKQFVEDGEYDNVRDALKDTWVSNYVYTYDMSMAEAYKEVATSILNMSDNDMDIVQEVMAGQAIRSYESAYKFYDILKSTMGIDGFVTEWNNDNLSTGKAQIVVAFDSNQFKNIDNENPTDNPDVRFSLSDNKGRELTKEQEEYFKDSVIKDKKGRLKVVYHGTTRTFNTFKSGDIGFHFGTKTAAIDRVGRGKNTRLVEAYVNITNPIVFDEDLGSWDADYRLAQELLNMGVITYEEGIKALRTDSGYKRTTGESNKALRELLQNKGYDGIVYKNSFEGNGGNSYIAFSSNQIKEISNATPTSDPDIRFSMSSNDDIAPVKADVRNEDADYFKQATDENIRSYLDNKGKPKAPADTKEPVYKQVSSEKKRKYGLGSAIDTFQTLFVNRNRQQDKLAKEKNNPEIKFKGDRANNVLAEVGGDIFKAQTDNYGNAIGPSLHSHFEPILKDGLGEYFDDYLRARSNIERHAQGKGSKESAQTSIEKVKAYEEKYPQFKKAGEGIDTYINNQLDNALENGLYGKEFIDILRDMYKHYVPFYSADTEGPSIDMSPDEIRSGRPIKRAKGGADNATLLGVEQAMMKQTISFMTNIAKNDLYKEIVTEYDGKQGIDTRTGEVIKPEDFLYEDESGKYLTAFSNGEARTAQIPEELFKELKRDLDNQVKEIENKLGVITKPLQTMSQIRGKLLTTFNPGFIVTNPIKDVQDALLNSKHTMRYLKNYLGLHSINDAAAGKLVDKYAKDFKQSTGMDIETVTDTKSLSAGDKFLYTKWKNGTMWNKFTTMYGGNSAQLEYNEYGDVDVEKIAKKNKKGLAKKLNFLRAIENANNYMEVASRYPEFRATLEKGGSTTEALYNAREVTTNFGRGGTVSRSVNRHGATFFNTSVQGMDKFFRNFTENGAEGFLKTAVKATMLGMTPAMLNHILLGGGYDDEYEALPDYVKSNYYLFRRDDGSFARIPKGRMISVFGSAGRMHLEKIMGDVDPTIKKDLDIKGNLKNMWEQVGANNPLEENIFAPVIQAHNNEAWYGGDLVPTRLQKLPVAEQYDASTDDFSKWLGEQFNMSPYKWNYVIDQYSGGIGDAILPYFTPEATSGAEGAKLAFAPILDKFVVNSTDDNKYVGELYDLSDKLKVQTNSSKATLEDILQYEYINDIASQMNELYATKRDIQADETLSKSEKYAEVQKVQDLINDLATEGVKNYNSGKSIELAYDLKPDAVVSKAYDDYKTYTTHRDTIKWDIKADKDENGESIRGSKQDKIIDYLNETDLDYGERIILFRQQYQSNDTYNEDIIDYLNSREDLYYEDVVAILESLGMKVREDGTVEW